MVGVEMSTTQTMTQTDTKHLSHQILIMQDTEAVDGSLPASFYHLSDHQFKLYAMHNQNNLYEVSDQHPDVLTANQLDLETELGFEQTDHLKNYATVNILEPINHVSYNIGTENVDTDEPLKNTETGVLQDGSVISEIENAAGSLFDALNNNCTQDVAKVNFDMSLFGPEDNFAGLFTDGTQQNVSSEANLVDLNKQIGANEAIEMSLVCEEEIPSQWVDVMSLAAAQPYEPPIEENPLSAVPTAVQTYMDMQTPEYGLIANVESEKRRNSDNVLKALTAQAEICTCSDCKCGPDNSCNGDDACGQVPALQSKCCGSNENIVGCSCSGPMGNNGAACCVMVCLRSLEQLRQVLSFTNKCCSLQSLAVGFGNTTPASGVCCNK